MTPAQLILRDLAQESESFAWQVGAIVLGGMGIIILAYLVCEAWHAWKGKR